MVLQAENKLFIFRAATVHIPKPPSKSTKSLQEMKAMRRKREAEVTKKIFFLYTIDFFFTVGICKLRV